MNRLIKRCPIAVTFLSRFGCPAGMQAHRDQARQGPPDSRPACSVGRVVKRCCGRRCGSRPACSVGRVVKRCVGSGLALSGDAVSAVGRGDEHDGNTRLYLCG